MQFILLALAIHCHLLPNSCLWVCRLLSKNCLLYGQVNLSFHWKALPKFLEQKTPTFTFTGFQHRLYEYEQYEKALSSQIFLSVQTIIMLSLR